MVAHVNSLVFQGLNACPVDVQVDIGPGMPAFQIVGLADKAIAEARERVRSALQAMGLALPPKRIIVNLAPANLTKEGSHLDVPIALGILVAMGMVPQEAVTPYLAMGELALDGSLLAISGILPAAMHCLQQGHGLICPALNGSEARWAGEVDVLAPTHLQALLQHLKGDITLPLPERPLSHHAAPGRDLRHVKGQHVARRALEVAAAGRHNLLMLGPPGAGKSLLASCLPSILPPLTAEEVLETSMIASIAGHLRDGQLHTTHPYRDPHHSSSMAAMIGGGRKATPGEISLAHNGVLFLDELPEFNRQVLESLRQPLETQRVSIARVQAHVTYPADFQLIAAMNPCRCGYLADAARACSKAPICGDDYQARLSGPLLDRLDMHVEVSAVEPADMLHAPEGEPSSIVAARVLAARQRQHARYEGTSIRTNARLDGTDLDRFAMPDSAGQKLLMQAAERMGLSMRGFNRIRRLARTIADLAGQEHIITSHVAEALQYRPVRFGKAAA